MVKQNQDTDQAFRRLFFLLVLLLLALVASTDHGNFHTLSAKSTLASHSKIDISGHDAIPGRMVTCIAAQKHFIADLKNRVLFPSSVKHRIPDYNRKMAHYFIYSRLTAVSIKPLSREHYLNLPHNRNDIPLWLN